MQNEMKDRLVELLEDSEGAVYWDSSDRGFIEKIADHLIENGVILLPCKVGDTVYYITGIHNRLIKSAIIEAMTINCDGIYELCVTSENWTFWNNANIFYKTREEAEKKLEEMSK